MNLDTIEPLSRALKIFKMGKSLGGKGRSPPPQTLYITFRQEVFRLEKRSIYTRENSSKLHYIAF